LARYHAQALTFIHCTRLWTCNFAKSNATSKNQQLIRHGRHGKRSSDNDERMRGFTQNVGQQSFNTIRKIVNENAREIREITRSRINKSCKTAVTTQFPRYSMIHTRASRQTTRIIIKSENHVGCSRATTSNKVSSKKNAELKEELSLRNSWRSLFDRRQTSGVGEKSRGFHESVLQSSECIVAYAHFIQMHAVRENRINSAGVYSVAQSTNRGVLI